MTLFCVLWMAVRLPPAVAWTRIFGEAPLWALLAGVAVGVALSMLTQALSRRIGALDRMARSLSAQLGGLSPAACVGLALMSSVAEELLFRGLLQPGLGVLPATVLFGLVHVPMERDLRAWPVLAMAIGGLFAWLFAWSGGLLAPVAAHFCLNALNLTWLARVQPRDGFLQ